MLIIKLKAVEVRMLSEGNRIYMAIDLKSFYASVECVERELDLSLIHIYIIYSCLFIQEEFFKTE